MSNRPHRNWRARLNAADYLAGMRRRLRLAYLAGLRDGEGREIDLFSLDRKK